MSHIVLKAKEKRWVLRRDLKTDREEACLMWRGRSFQSFGAATAKARSPLSFLLVFGTLRSSWSADLREQVGAYGCRSSER